ncbi:S41 family peptidase [Shewanella salipaludis]|uniref:S41 family peptidase n=1 Tax=Shewanella salipaludis TaxID=2723052 RepID=A0A972JM97_9GAMM|nr:S41 family peptidase [Shewanella salipaludis]NMH66277.1 S41 family peptidase [Shewanella salipaludis]
MSSYIRYLCCLVLGLTLGLSVTLSGKENTQAQDSQFDFPLLLDVVDTIETYYVQPMSKEELIQAAIQGIFAHLDPYSSLLNYQEQLSLRDSNKGEYFGFGFEIATDSDKITIVAPFPNSPAAHAGIRAGDQIIALNDVQVSAGNLSELLQEIKQHSLKNQAIDLVISHQNAEGKFQIMLSPALIEVDSVEGKILDNKIGYIRLSSFQEDSTQDMMKLLQGWQSQPLKGLILDLRNNPGGLLDQAIKIADLFLAKGKIVSTSGRFFDANSEYYASSDSLMTDKPMLVLINKGSASASEVLAAALQENGRAKLMGQTSFGKGTVQSLIPTLNQGNAIKLTIAHYQTPNGEDIHAKGIKPDIKFPSETVLAGENMPIIEPSYPHDDIAKDTVVNSAIAWIKTNN